MDVRTTRKPPTHTLLTLTPEIREICATYDRSRPANLEQSMLFSPPSVPELGLGRQVVVQAMHQGGENLLAAAMGHVGGVQGVVVAGLFGAGQGVVNELWTWATKDDLPSATVPLSYLVKLDFNENENLPQGVLANLKAWHDEVVDYQELKKSRGWILGYGKNYQENVIDDPKYFAAILIAHIIEALAKASSRAEYELRMQHLKNFIQNLTQVNTLLDTRSDDTHYRALRTLILILKMQICKSENEQNSADNDYLSILKELQSSISDIATSADKIVSNELNNVLNMGSVYTKEDIDYFTRNKTDTFHAQDVRLGKLKQNDVFVKLHTYLQGDGENIDPAVFGDLLANAAKINRVYIQESVCEAFQSVFAELKHLDRLKQLLDEISPIVIDGGVSALVPLLPEINKLTCELERSIKSLKTYIRKLNVELNAVYLKSQDLSFKNKIAEFNFKLLSDESNLIVKLQGLDNTLKLLDKVDGLSERVEAAVDKKIQALKVRVNDELGHSNNGQSANIKEPLDIQASSRSYDDFSVDFDAFMTEVVMVDLNQSILDQRMPVIPDAVVQEMQKQEHGGWLPTVIKLFKGNDKTEEITALNKQIEELQKERDDLREKNQTAYKKISSFEGQDKIKDERIATLEEQNKIKDEQILTLATNQENHALFNQLVQHFSSFCEDYKGHTCTGFLGIFSAHGNTGRDTAVVFESLFNNKMNDIRNSPTYSMQIFKPISEITKAITDLRKESAALLTGGNSDHSFKTYLNAYENYLIRLTPNTKVDSIDVGAELNSYLQSRKGNNANTTSKSSEKVKYYGRHF